MTKSKLERLVDIAEELVGVEDSPGYLAQALAASILKTCKDYTDTEETTYACIVDTLALIDNEQRHMSVDILSAIIGRIIYESKLPDGHICSRMRDPAIASIRGAYTKRLIDNV